MYRFKMDKLPIETEHVAELRLAQASRTLRNHFKYGLGVGRRARDDAQHICSGRLLLERLAQLTRTFLLCLEQARVLDGNYGLVSEGLYELDLFIGERAKG